MTQNPQLHTCWVVSDGGPGMENEARGLAEALHVPFVIKRVRPRAPWTWLPARAWPRPFASLGSDSDTLEPPWPDLVIGCGRKSVPLTLAIRKASRGRSFTVQLQHPRVPIRCFDLVVPPNHDRLNGPNVIATRGALHRVTPKLLAEGAVQFAASVAQLPRPLVAVLIGGSSAYYRLTADTMRRIADDLLALTQSAGCGLMITPSRRTGAENERILRERLKAAPAIIWDGTGDNPYFGFLALADFVLVTGDSVAMASEACSTGKPVYIIALPGSGRKFEAFHAELRAGGMTRPFAGKLESWTYLPLDDTAMVAAEIKRRLGLAA
jgi:uncharacterized protein